MASPSLPKVPLASGDGRSNVAESPKPTTVKKDTEKLTGNKRQNEDSFGEDDDFDPGALDDMLEKVEKENTPSTKGNNR